MPDVYLKAYFEDDAHNFGYETYRLRTELLADGSNMDAVLDDVADIETNLNILTKARIPYFDIVIRDTGNDLTAPNDSSTLREYAFVRTLDATTNLKSSVVIPAWDTVLFEESGDNAMLDPTFEAAFLLLNALIAEIDTGNNMTLEWAQARSRKRGQKAS